jgi:hypothetical protein
MSKRAPSRRAVLGSGASLLLLTAAAAGPAKADELDGELLDLCIEFQEKEAILRRLDNWFRFVDFDGPEHASQQQARSAELDAGNEEWHELLDEIIEIPARTPEGLRAKAAVLLPALNTFAVSEWDAKVEEDATAHERLAWSLAQDLLGRAA